MINQPYIEQRRELNRSNDNNFLVVSCETSSVLVIAFHMEFKGNISNWNHAPLNIVAIKDVDKFIDVIVF